MTTQSGPENNGEGVPDFAFIKETTVTPRMRSEYVDKGQKSLPNPNTRVRARGFCRPP